MKLIVQIPCLNEASTLPIVLKKLPRIIDGFDQVEWLIIDDGSTDDTSEIAKAHGVDHIVRFTQNQGLAKAFMAGLEKACELGADVITNIDADNQYDASGIPLLLAPIMEGQADLVIGERPIDSTEHFSWHKKKLQKLGSYVVRKLSGTSVKDAPSGFRAISRKAALQLNVFNEYTYTLETIIQAGHKGIAVCSVPIETNPDQRPSRLVKSIFSYVYRSILTIFRIFAVYQPLRTFSIIGLFPFLAGFMLGIRFLIFWLAGQGEGKIQSLLLAGLLMSIGFMLFVLALLADLISVNRKLLEKIDYKISK